MGQKNAVVFCAIFEIPQSFHSFGMTRRWACGKMRRRQKHSNCAALLRRRRFSLDISNDCHSERSEESQNVVPLF